MVQTIVKSVLVIGLLSIYMSGHGQKSSTDKFWPAITSESKPWTRWWWHGSAVTREGITRELTLLAEAGFGGVEITPIYGAFGHEQKFITFLSPEWIKILSHTLSEAKRLGLGVDMATGTGWPFGGPWISDEHACRNVKFKVYEINGNQDIPSTIEYLQEPLLRRVGFNIPGESHSSDINSIKDLKDPVEGNPHLQVLAIDQIRFEKRIPLQALMAYDDNGSAFDITDHVTPNGKLQWSYPGGRLTLVAAFSGWHGKLVERAGPGGEGNVIDHFSVSALQRYLSRFDSAFSGVNLQSLRCFFNDSYEVDDASGSADWTPQLFEEFKQRRGYDLRLHLRELSSTLISDTANRILCDYRETLSEMLLQNFTAKWKSWANERGGLVRNQAHGSPANILDLYAAVDIPEIEGEEPLRIKMASSAGNVTGKKLISAEAVTWLDEHFQSNLADIKTALDRFMVNGVNHLVYHGTSYSPQDEPWPGWLFYAAVHVNSRNPLWRDLPALNQYVARCQSLLQNATSDNDVLVYYPVYDRFSMPGPEMIEHFDGIGKQFEGTAFARCAENLLHDGYAFDYISDQQILGSEVRNGKIKTAGPASYKALVIPKCRYIPAQTLSKIRSLVTEGANVVFFEGLPESFAGFGRWNLNLKQFNEAVQSFRALNFDHSPSSIAVGKGKAVGGTVIRDLMSSAGVKAETMKQKGLDFIRKKINNDIVYFVVNQMDEQFEGKLTLTTEGKTVEAYDPMTGVRGKLTSTVSPGAGTTVDLTISPKQSVVLKVTSRSALQTPFPIYRTSGEELELTGPWTVSFVDGGPSIPKALTLEHLVSWTQAGVEYERFSGSAKYTYVFSRPLAKHRYWELNLGAVHESASVHLNGNYIGTCFGPQYKLVIATDLLRDNNILEILVSNTMANRIAYMDRAGIPWKRFYNINFPARKSGNVKNGLFSAAEWAPASSGLIGPVRLIPLSQN